MNRIRYPEKKVAYQGKLLENCESFRSHGTHKNNPKPDIHNASNDGEAHNWTGYYCLNIKEIQKEIWRKYMSGRP